MHTGKDIGSSPGVGAEMHLSSISFRYPGISFFVIVMKIRAIEPQLLRCIRANRLE
jgi:hypothetical protein